MHSCTSLGIKLGGGLGTAVAGWMLAASGFDGAAAVQPESCIRMLCFMYLWVPVIISFIITFVLSKMNVEQTNAELRKKRSGEFLWSDIDTKM